MFIFQQARTEKILNNLNPSFAKTLVTDYYFEEVQKLKFAVFDIDNETQTLGDDDFLGEVECTLGHVSSLYAVCFSTTLRLLTMVLNIQGVPKVAHHILILNFVLCFKFDMMNLIN